MLGNLRWRRAFASEVELETAEDLADALIMGAGDMVEGAICGCASLGCQDMDEEMEIDAISESLDDCHNSWHQLPAGGCMQKFLILRRWLFGLEPENDICADPVDV